MKTKENMESLKALFKLTAVTLIWLLQIGFVVVAVGVILNVY